MPRSAHQPSRRSDASANRHATETSGATVPSWNLMASQVVPHIKVGRTKSGSSDGTARSRAAAAGMGDAMGSGSIPAARPAAAGAMAVSRGTGAGRALGGRLAELAEGPEAEDEPPPVQRHAQGRPAVHGVLHVAGRLAGAVALAGMGRALLARRGVEP